MSELVTLIETYGPTSLLVIIILLISAAIGIYTVAKKIKEMLEDYRNKVNAEENKDKTTKDRLDKLEKSHEENTAKIDNMSKLIEEIKDSIEKLRENQNKANIATCRSSMYRLATDLINQEYMSQTEYDTLSDLTDVYLMSGGSNYVRPSLVQRALSLPVLTDAEIEIKRSKTRVTNLENNRKSENNTSATE